MKRLLFALFILIFAQAINAHPWKPSHYVIIDTDGGVDDLKAITLMLASPDIRVLAITVSPGVLGTENAFKKVKSLLNSFHHEGIPVGINRNAAFKSPEFANALNTIWGNEGAIDPSSAPSSAEVINDVLSKEKTKVSFVCLGGLNTAFNSMKKLPVFTAQVKEIVWSAEGSDDKKGFNYNIDPASAARIMKEAAVLKIVRTGGNEIFYSDSLVKEIGRVRTPYAGKLSDFFKSGIPAGHEYSLMAKDELVPLCLQFPSSFRADSAGNKIEYSVTGNKSLENNLVSMLKGETVPKNQVIKNLPLDPSFYFDDINPSVNEIIEKFGVDEWTSGVIANELHRHLGVYAIIGVKMGIRAREYFDTGVDEFTVTSFAGSEPPLSCMNDGLQVSTGATPGHGLLTVRNDTTLSPRAIFTYLNRKIMLTLNPDIEAKISAELKQINFVYGLDSNIYWELVRKNTIKYWRDLDRHEIFTIEVVH
jgi:inosine-uridine nucleoside N-ribohydrolase